MKREISEIKNRKTIQKNDETKTVILEKNK